MGGVYYFGKAIEAVSVKLRVGTFEVGENWQCQDCNNNDTLCADCKDSWVYELSQLEYSNEYERRLGVASGTSAIIMGFMAFFGNVSMSFWDSGPLLEALSSSLHLALPNPWKTYYNYTLLVLFLLASFVFWSAQLIGLFLGMMNPMATRHWRHMTASVWSGFFAFFVAIMMLAIYNPLGDLIFVFWPIMTGLVICGVSLCMDMQEGEGLIRLDAEEKQ